MGGIKAILEKRMGARLNKAPRKGGASDYLRKNLIKEW